MIEDGKRPPPTGRRRDDGLGLSVEELALWRRAMGDVRRLRDGARPNPVPAPPAAGEPPAPAAATPEPPPRTAPAVARPMPPAASPRLRPPPVLEPGSAPDLDKRTLTRLKRGLIAPEATIDLHSLTQAQAHGDLDRFLAVAQAAGRRCVLIVTGKGYGSGGAIGVLKTMVPRWLNEAPNRERVLAFCHAPAQHGGEGALYVLLRRRRTR